jgi:hypothetical protein
MHRWGFTQAAGCNNLNDDERSALFSVYRRAISHGFNTDPKANASATVGGSNIDVNFTNFSALPNCEAAQTLIHELMHCAGYRHPDPRDPAPGKPRDCNVDDCPGDNGPYYGTAPLRAELCIVGVQSDTMTCVAGGRDLRSQIVRPYTPPHD